MGTQSNKNSGEYPIYFTKVEFRSSLIYVGLVESILLLNLAGRELSYQAFRHKMNMPVISGIKCTEFHGTQHFWKYNASARFMRNARTDFKPILLKTEPYEQEVVFSFTRTLSDRQVEALKPYCNAYDFEPYRGRTMSMGDEGFVGYRDEIRMDFTAVTDSHIPLLRLPMNYYYDEEHIWPSEKLYRYLVKTFFNDTKKFARWGPQYGTSSLFF